MDEDTPDYAPGEPVVTGHVQIAVSGDRAAALGHVRQGRRLLGALRAAHGIDARIAAGQPGGFFQRSMRLTDGSRIIATSNDGHDTLRIDVPVALPPAPLPLAGEAPPPPQPPSLVGPHSFINVGHTPVITPELVPAPPADEDEDEDEPTEDYLPYLWIGVRYANKPGPFDSSDAFHQLHVCLWEPAVNGADPLILSNRNEFIGVNSGPGGIYPLGSWTQFTPAGDYNGIAYTDDHLFMLVPINGYPMRIPNYVPGRDDDVEWDVIFISDYENDMELLDADGLDMVGTGIGNYYLKVMVTGPDCRVGAGAHYPPQAGVPYAPVEVEIMIITGKYEYRTETLHQVTIREFTECKQGIMPFGYYPPANTAPDYGHPDNCHGANPHGPHWWQGMALVVVPPIQFGVPPAQIVIGTAGFSRDGQVEVPPTGFEISTWPDMCMFTPSIHYKQLYSQTFCDFEFPHETTTVASPFDGTVNGTLQTIVHMRTLRRVTTLTFYKNFAQFALPNGGYGPITETTTGSTTIEEGEWETVFENTIDFTLVTLTGIPIEPWPDWATDALANYPAETAICDGEFFGATGAMELVPY